jgi:hypothetical protein
VPGRDVVQTAERKVGFPHHRSMTSSRGDPARGQGWDDYSEPPKRIGFQDRWEAAQDTYIHIHIVISGITMP